MLSLKLADILRRNQELVTMSQHYNDAARKKLERDLSKISFSNIFDRNFFTFVSELKHIQVWSSRLCWLSGCYISSCQNTVQKCVNNIGVDSILQRKLIDSTTNFYEVLSHNTEITFPELYALMTDIGGYLEQTGNPLIEFSCYVFQSLEQYFSIEQEILETQQFQSNFSYSTIDFKRDGLDKVSLPQLLLDIIIDIIAIIADQSLSLQFFVIAPDIHVFVFAGTINEKLYAKGLIISQDQMQIISDDEANVLLGTITVCKCNIKLALDDYFMQDEINPSENVEYCKYVCNNLQGLDGFLTGMKHRTLFCGNEVQKVLVPIHYRVDPLKINASDLLQAALASSFQKNDIAGIIDEDTGKVLLQHDCKTINTSWYNICLYYFALHMKLLGEDIYDSKIVLKPLTQRSWDCFLSTSAHYFVNDFKIIKTFWLNPMYHSIIPLKLGLFFLPKNHMTYKINIRNFTDESVLYELHVDENFKLVYEDQHRNLDVEIYSIMIFAQTEPSVRSYALSFNTDNQYILNAFFPLLDPNVTSIIPLSPHVKEKMNQDLLIIELIKSHSKEGKKYLVEKYVNLFPPQNAWIIS